MKRILILAAAMSLSSPLFAQEEFNLDGISSVDVPAVTQGEPGQGEEEQGTEIPFFAAADTMVYDDAGTPVFELRTGEPVKFPGKVREKDGKQQYYVYSPNRYNESGMMSGWADSGGIASSEPQDWGEFSIARQFNDMSGTTGGCGGSFVEKARGFTGVPYVWGGESHKGVDCSGLVMASLLEAGCSKGPFPRTAAEQQKKASPLGGPQELQPGDLIFSGTPAHHVVIVTGNDGQGRITVIEAQQTGTNVYEHEWRNSGDKTFGRLL